MDCGFDWNHIAGSFILGVMAAIVFIAVLGPGSSPKDRFDP